MKLQELSRRFLTPPIFPEDDEKTRQAHVLHTLTVNLGALIILAITFGTAFIFTEKFYTTLLLGFTLWLVLISNWLMHRGHVRTGSFVITSMLWLVTTVLAYVSGGMHSYHASLYLSGTVIAGLLLGLPGSLVFGISALGSGLIMTLMDNTGFQFPSLFAYPTGSLWVILFVNIVAILLPLSITLRSLSTALAQAHQELDDRKRAEEVAQRRARENELLYELGLSAARGQDLYSTLYAIQQKLMLLIQADAFFIAMYDAATDMVSYPIFFNEGEPYNDPPRRLSVEPGLTGAVIFSRETLYLPNLMTAAVEDSYHPVNNTNDLVLHTFLGVPLITNGRVIGMLSVQSKQVNAYNAEQIKLVEAIATQAVAAIDKTRLLEELQSELVERKLAELALREERDQLAQRRASMEKVIELGKTIAQVTDLSECLRVSYQAIQKGLGFDRVGLFLYDDRTDTIRGAFGTNRAGEIEDTSQFVQRASGYDAWQRALSNPSGITIVDNYQDEHHFDSSNEMYGVKQHVTLAAWAGDTPVALITVDNVTTQRTITTDQIETLRLLAGYIGLSIRNAALNDDLERRVHERTAQLEATMSELDSFSFSVAHDLRAPLRGMRGFSQIVLEENSSILDERARNHLLRITTSAKQMGELIDALLDFSRLTRLEMQREEVNLSVLAYDIVGALKRAEPKRALRFEITAGLTAQADRRLMRIALEHLFSNAWKFTSKKEDAIISFGVDIQNTKRIFCIRDNGAGFNMEYSQKLFGAFQRLHHPDEFPGHGAGLAITQRIIKKHGGRIWAEGIVEQGAAFYFTLE